MEGGCCGARGLLMSIFLARVLDEDLHSVHECPHVTPSEQTRQPKKD